MEIFGQKSANLRFPVGIVVSRFNEEVTQLLFDGAVQRLKELGIPDEWITVAWVPGAVEIPVVVQRFAHTKKFQAIIALGSVIRGETNHYEYVCEQVSNGCQIVALRYDIPVVFGVLTTENQLQALDRVGGEHGHKGRDAADVAMSMVSVMKEIDFMVLGE